jgi:hypothetical protein
MAEKDGREREALTKEQQKHVREALRWAHIRPLPHACYRTAQGILFADLHLGRIRYQEGMLAKPGINPVQHAWNTIDGRLFDLTQDMLEKRQGERKEARYFGFEVPTDEVKRIVGKRLVHMSVLEEICRERNSSVHIFSEYRFVPVWQEAMVKTGRRDTAGDDGRYGSLITTFEEFLEAVEDYARRMDAIQKLFYERAKNTA